MHTLLPSSSASRAPMPQVLVDVRRVPSRQMAAEILNRSLDFGVLTFQPADKGLQSIALGRDELVLLDAARSIRWPRGGGSSLEEVGRQMVIAHNDPSPARERVLRLVRTAARPDQHPDGAAEPGRDQAGGGDADWGWRVLPRRCALAEISRGQLAAVNVPGLGSARQVRLVFRRGGELSHAAEAFLETVQGARGLWLRRAEAWAEGYGQHPLWHRQGCRCAPSISLHCKPCLSRQLQPDRRRGVVASTPSRTAAAPRPPRLPRSDRAAARSRPSVPSRNDSRAAGGQRDVARDARRRTIVWLSRSTVDRGRRVAFDRSPSADSMSSGDAVRHGSPSATELPKKISENDSPTTARMPQRWIACGACSREEPQPKLRVHDQEHRAPA